MEEIYDFFQCLRAAKRRYMTQKVGIRFEEVYIDWLSHTRPAITQPRGSIAKEEIFSQHDFPLLLVE